MDGPKREVAIKYEVVNVPVQYIIIQVKYHETYLKPNQKIFIYTPWEF